MKFATNLMFQNLFPTFDQLNFMLQRFDLSAFSHCSMQANFIIIFPCDPGFSKFQPAFLVGSL